MIPALAGGALIGLGASLFWYGNGRVAGVSGVLYGAIHGRSADRTVRIAFLLGLIAAGWMARVGGAEAHTVAPLGAVALAGVLVGFGARLGGGCTSGHGVCGLSRFSLRSLVATITFIATGAITVFATRHLFPVLGGFQ